MYRKILVPLDGSPLAECVLPHVESIARGCAPAQVILVRAVEPFQLPVGDEGYAFNRQEVRRIQKDWDDQKKVQAEEYLNRMGERFKGIEGISVQTTVLVGRPVEALTAHAEKQGVDLIAIATHGESGISRWVWGSVADRLLRSSCVPVLMVRAPGCVPGI
jgi:nucleotide-binding universal stress UspA family protein